MAEETRPNRKIGQLLPAEYRRGDWVAEPQLGTQFAELTVPEYWAAVANLVNVWDRIEARSADGSWWAELLVTAKEPFALKVHVLRHLDLRHAPSLIDMRSETPEGYEVRFRGDKARWCVLRLSDKVWVRRDEPTEDHAHLWLLRHLRALAGTATEADRKAVDRPVADLIDRPTEKPVEALPR